MSGRVLITGATGFTGSFLVEAYAHEGWEVHGTCRTRPDDLSWLPRGVRLHHLDLCDPQATRALLQSVRPDTIQHLAAQSSVAAAQKNPMSTLTDNAGAQHALLEGVRSMSLDPAIVVVGSCDEYGRVSSEGNPIDEATPLRPVNPYALSKVVQDLMGYQYYAESGLRVVRARPFLQLGPRRSDRFVAGSFARQVAEIALGRREARVVVGSIDLRRDFSDVRDVATALILLASEGHPGEVYNIASGTDHTLREMLGLMLRIAGVEAEVCADPTLQRPGEAHMLVGDATRLRRTTGWEPTISFERSVADTLAYWVERKGASQVPAGETV